MPTAREPELHRSRALFIVVLIALLFAPAAAQAIAIAFQHYGLGLLVRLLVHVALPVVVVVFFQKQSWWIAFIDPIKPKDTVSLGWAIKTGFWYGLAAIVIILGAFLVLQPWLNLDDIRDNLLANFRIQRTVFPLVALAIVLINPFLEEYFWRGSIYHLFRTLAVTRRQRTIIAVVTGIFFALHHLLIIQGWFTWWQFLLSTIFLAGVGILFNWLYEHSGSIIASWLTHVCADITIVAIGLYLFGFIE